MANGFGLKVGVEGEAEFKQAIAEMNRDMKELGSEAKLAASQFDKNDKSTRALAAQNEVLAKQIAATKDKIETMNKALADAVSKYGENSEEAQEWRTKINGATAEQNKLERALRKNEQAIHDNSLAAKAAHAALEGLGTVAKATGAALAAGAAALAAETVAIGKALVEMSKGGAAYADTVLTESTVTGIATDKLQEYMYAAELVDVSTEALTGSMAKNIKSMKSAADGTGEAAEAYKALGVDVTAADGSLRDSEAVYWELIEALGEVQNETERDALAMTVLGKSAQDLNPLIEAGAGRMQELGKEARAAGYVLSGDALDAYGAFDDGIQRLTNGATAAKNALGTILLPALTSLAGDGVDLLGEFTRGVAGANGDIGKIGEVVRGMAPEIAGVISETLPEVAGLVSDAVGAVMDVMTDDKVMKTVLSAAGEILKTLGEGLLKNIPKIVTTAISVVRSLCEYILAPESIRAITNAAVEVLGVLVRGLADALPTLVPAAVGAIMVLTETLLEPGNLQMLLDAVLQIIIAVVESLADAAVMIVDALPAIIDNVVQFLTSPDTVMMIFEAGLKLIGALLKAIPEVAVSVTKGAWQIVGSFVDGIKQRLSSIWDVGKNMVIGLWEGIKSMGAWIWDNLFGWASDIVDSIKGFFGIHSPSTVFAGIGKNMGAGLSDGFIETMKDAENEMKDSIPRDFDIEASANIRRTVYDVSPEIRRQDTEDERWREYGAFEKKKREDGNDRAGELVQLLREQNRLLGLILGKDQTVRIGDREIGRANARYEERRGPVLNPGTYANAY